jgi:thymidylate synthase ThyX
MFNPRPLEEFIGLVSSSAAKKEIRLGMDVAKKIADNLSYLLLQLAQYQDSKADQATVNNAVSRVELQGGKF